MKNLKKRKPGSILARSLGFGTEHAVSVGMRFCAILFHQRIATTKSPNQSFAETN